MAYQARVAIDRIKFAIKHADQFGKPCDAMREAGMQLLDALNGFNPLTVALDPVSNGRSHKNGGGEG